MKKAKNEYTLKDNIGYMLRNWWNFDKKGIIFYFIRIIPLVVLPIVTGLTTKLMIDAVEDGLSIAMMVLIVGAMSIVIAGLTWIDPFLHSICSAVIENVSTKYRIDSFKKMMYIDYSILESSEGRFNFEKSRNFTIGNRNASKVFSDTMVHFCVSIIGILSYLVILSVLDFVLIITLLLSGAVSLVAVVFWAHFLKKVDTIHGKMNMKNEYLFRTLNNFTNAKDIKIYSFSNLFNKYISKNRRGFVPSWKIEKRVKIAYGIVQALMIAISEAIGFFVLYNGVFNRNIIISDFVFYFGLVTGFNGWVSRMTWMIFNLNRVSDQCGYYRKFMASDENRNTVVTTEYEEKFKDYSIVFDNVSFKYNENGEYILKNVNLMVKDGEKIAIVGENGAGKTTFVKLMCGFYSPSEGNIFVNGKNVEAMDKEDRFKLFSAVFQDYIVLPMSIEKNIALCLESDIDRQKLELVINQSGLLSKVEKLPLGVKTKLVKKIYSDAVDLSGGETQKMLLARALYKDAPILVLDEPTAALDPIAENNMYLKYNEFSRDKTSFFISHRLSSTRFCDRIIYLREGSIAEEGDHESLMENKSFYYNMFQMQSNYYKM